MSIVAMKNWRDYPDGREKYNLYLASREWALLKDKARKRCGEKCERCFNAPCEQLHHQTYERKYAELLEDLVYLCAPCHEFLSGKRTDDPALKAPPRLMGRAIKRVYLAGKITGQRWRDQIVKGGWSFENHGAVDFNLESGRWSTVQGCLPLPGGRRLDLTGPYWRAAPCGGHSDISCSTGPHAFATEYQRDEHGQTYTSPADVPALTEQIRSAIDVCDLFFAWIDSHDCFGTLVEIGYAKAKSCVVVIGHKPDFDKSEVWLAFQMAHITGAAATPEAAWHGLWTTPKLVVAPPRSH